MCGPAQKKTEQVKQASALYTLARNEKWWHTDHPFHKAYMALFASEDKYAWAKTYHDLYHGGEDARFMREALEKRTGLACEVMREAAKVDLVLPRTFFQAFPEAAKKVTCKNIRGAK